MRAIAEILEELPDEQSRARVLRWCEDHFPCDARPAGPRPPASGADDRQRPSGDPGGLEHDPALTIDEDVFDAPPRKRHPVHCDDDIDEDIVPDRVHCDDSVDLFDEEPAAPAFDDDLSVTALEPERSEPEPQRPAATGLGLESVLRDFVADFQRLALAFA